MRTTTLACAVLLLLAGACTHKVQVEPIEVKPLHMTLDINIKVDRELDDFFDFKQPPPAAPGSVGAPSADAAAAPWPQTQEGVTP